jgi:hypothetical protein
MGFVGGVEVGLETTITIGTRIASPYIAICPGPTICSLEFPTRTFVQRRNASAAMRAPAIAPRIIRPTAEVEVAQFLGHRVRIAVRDSSLDDDAAGVAAGAPRGFVLRFPAVLVDAFAGEGRRGEEGEEERGDDGEEIHGG